MYGRVHAAFSCGRHCLDFAHNSLRVKTNDPAFVVEPIVVPLLKVLLLNTSHVTLVLLLLVVDAEICCRCYFSHYLFNKLVGRSRKIVLA